MIIIKKIFALAIIAASCSSLHAQENLSRVAENFFRINPFNRQYSKFFTELVNDPLIASKAMRKRTDTTLFSFEAQYKDYSPYTSFKADRAEIRLLEKEVDVGDSTTRIDTIFIYQLIGYKYGQDGVEDVKKEFNKFNRRFKNEFFTSQQSDLQKDEKIIGAMTNYFVLTTTTSPLNVSWFRIDESNTAFSIAFRFKISDNRAILPVPPDRGE